MRVIKLMTKFEKISDTNPHASHGAAHEFLHAPLLSRLALCRHFVDHSFAFVGGDIPSLEESTPGTTMQI